MKLYASNSPTINWAEQVSIPGENSSTIYPPAERSQGHSGTAPELIAFKELGLHTPNEADRESRTAARSPCRPCSCAADHTIAVPRGEKSLGLGNRGFLSPGGLWGITGLSGAFKMQAVPADSNGLSLPVFLGNGGVHQVQNPILSRADPENSRRCFLRACLGTRRWAVLPSLPSPFTAWPPVHGPLFGLEGIMLEESMIFPPKSRACSVIDPSFFRFWKWCISLGRSLILYTAFLSEIFTAIPAFIIPQAKKKHNVCFPSSRRNPPTAWASFSVVSDKQYGFPRVFPRK